MYTIWRSYIKELEQRFSECAEAQSLRQGDGPTLPTIPRMLAYLTTITIWESPSFAVSGSALSFTAFRQALASAISSLRQQMHTKFQDHNSQRFYRVLCTNL